MYQLLIPLLAMCLSIIPNRVVATNAPRTDLLKIEHVESMQVDGGLPGRPDSPIFRNDSHDIRGKELVIKIFEWINSAKPVSGQTYYGMHGYPSYLKIQMDDGKDLYIEPAFNCVYGGNLKTCSMAEGEVVITYMHEKIKTRHASPQLYDWLRDGWKKEKWHPHKKTN